jgi:hypothetical protein
MQDMLQLRNEKKARKRPAVDFPAVLALVVLLFAAYSAGQVAILLFNILCVARFVQNGFFIYHTSSGKFKDVIAGIPNPQPFTFALYLDLCLLVFLFSPWMTVPLHLLAARLTPYRVEAMGGGPWLQLWPRQGIFTNISSLFVFASYATILLSTYNVLGNLFVMGLGLALAFISLRLQEDVDLKWSKYIANAVKDNPYLTFIPQHSDNWTLLYLAIISIGLLKCPFLSFVAIIPMFCKAIYERCCVSSEQPMSWNLGPFGNWRSTINQEWTSLPIAFDGATAGAREEVAPR